MGKRKIGEIYNKPIVEGDINLKTPNEIHKSELSGGGGSSEVKESDYVYMKLVDPSGEIGESFNDEITAFFPISTIIGEQIQDFNTDSLYLHYLTAIQKCIKSIAGNVYVQESGDGSAGLGGKISPWDLCTTLNNNWNGGISGKVKAIQFYKNIDNLGYSFAESAPKPNYNIYCTNDVIFNKATEYFKNKVNKFMKDTNQYFDLFSEYETINIFVFYTVFIVAYLNNPDNFRTSYKSCIDKIIEEMYNGNYDVLEPLMIFQKKTFVEITKEEYDNICIDAMKSQRINGTFGPTIHEAYIENENAINELFKQ